MCAKNAQVASQILQLFCNFFKSTPNRTQQNATSCDNSVAKKLHRFGKNDAKTHKCNLLILNLLRPCEDTQI